MKTDMKTTKAGVVAALISLGYFQDSGPFPNALKTVSPSASFTGAEMEFAKYMIYDTDFGGCWNDANQINMHLA